MVFPVVSHLPKALSTVKVRTFKGILDQFFFILMSCLWSFERETKEHLLFSATEVVTPALL